MPDDAGRLPVSCPVSVLPGRRFHEASYDPEDGVWVCRACGLVGTTRGLVLLTEMEAELSGLYDERELWFWHGLVERP